MVRWVVAGLFVALVGCDDSAPASEEPNTGGTAGTAGAASGGSQSGGSGGVAGSGTSGMSGAAGSANGGGSAGTAMQEGCSPAPAVYPNMNPNAVLIAGGDNMQDFQNVHASGDHVFYVSGAGIERVAKTGGTPERVFSDSTRPRIRVGPDDIYWIRDGGLLSVPRDATEGAATTVAADIGADEPNDNLLFVDATHAYFWVRTTSTIHRLDLSTTDITEVATGTTNITWYVYDGFLYFDDDYDFIYRVPLSGGTPEQLRRSSDFVWALAADASGLFVGRYGTITLSGETMSTTLMRFQREYVERLAIMGERLLFSSGSMGWVMKDGTACAIIGAAGEGDDWSYDDDYVYLADGGRLYRISP